MSEESKDGGPAFPCPIDDDGGWYNAEANGMSLRAYIAIKAMHAFLSHPDSAKWTQAEIVSDSCSYADAMIAALKGGASEGVQFKEIQVRRSDADYKEYLRSRFEGGRPRETFMFRGHRWRYRHDSFDDEGEFVVLERPLKGGAQ